MQSVDCFAADPVHSIKFLQHLSSQDLKKAILIGRVAAENKTRPWSPIRAGPLQETSKPEYRCDRLYQPLLTRTTFWSWQLLPLR